VSPPHSYLFADHMSCCQYLNGLSDQVVTPVDYKLTNDGFNPPIVLQDVILPLVELTIAGLMPQRQTTQFLALHGLTSANHFVLIELLQAKDMVKVLSARHPAQEMGILIQNNLTGLIWHIKDRTHCGLPIDANNIVLDDLHSGHMAYEAYVQNRDKGENIKAPEKWCDKYDFDIEIVRSLRPYPLYTGIITAPLLTSSGRTSQQDGIRQSML
jgi:hypothetical protein